MGLTRSGDLRARVKAKAAEIATVCDRPLPHLQPESGTQQSLSRTVTENTGPGLGWQVEYIIYCNTSSAVYEQKLYV